MLRVLAASLLALSLAACKADEPEAAKPCDAGVLKPANPAVSLPAGIPAGVNDPVFYETQQAGVTKFYFAHASGSDVVAVRDAIAAAFEGGGLTIESKDAEPPAEAEFQFSGGDREGSVQVTPLCEGKVTIRWRVGPR